MPYQLFQQIEGLRLDDELVVIRPKLLRYQARILDLIEPRIPRETNAKGGDGLIHELAHEGDDDAGVNATAEKSS